MARNEFKPLGALIAVIVVAVALFLICAWGACWHVEKEDVEGGDGTELTEEGDGEGKPSATVGANAGFVPLLSLREGAQ